MEIIELSMEEMEQVSGGIVRNAVIGWVVGKALDGLMSAASWAAGAASGGADQTTWENVGNSQMGA